MKLIGYLQIFNPNFVIPSSFLTLYSYGWYCRISSSSQLLLGIPQKPTFDNLILGRGAERVWKMLMQTCQWNLVQLKRCGLSGYIHIRRGCVYPKIVQSKYQGFGKVLIPKLGFLVLYTSSSHLADYIPYKSRNCERVISICLYPIEISLIPSRQEWTITICLSSRCLRCIKPTVGDDFGKVGLCCNCPVPIAHHP